jgi:hypothetical protein
LLAQRFGPEPLPDGHPYQWWPSHTVDVLFLIAIVATAFCVSLAGKWWWLAGLIALPLLLATWVAFTFCGMWIDGTYL